MQTMTATSTEQQVKLPIRVRGRTYPIPDLETDSHDENASRQADPSSIHKQLSKLITERLSFFNHSRRGTTAELTEVYVDSLQTLERFRQDTQDLIPHLCEANLIFRQESGTTAEKARREVLANKMSEMIAKTRLEIRRAKNLIDAKLLALPAEAASKLLRKSLEENVQRFVSDFFEALDQLVDQQIAGLVEWAGQNACCYHFFREVVIQEHDSTTEKSNGRRRSVSSATGWVEELTTTNRGTHTHRLARHEHHTTDAFYTTIEDTQVVMPLAVRKLVDNIPEWLSPIVRVIDGKLAREIVIERDIKTEAWEQHEVKDVPVFGCEPAVVIDHIVLTGWGPRDIDAEIARQREVTRVEKLASEQKKARRFVPAGWTFGICFSILSLWLFSQSSTPAGLAGAFLTLLLAVPCWISAVVHSATTSERPTGAPKPILASLGITAALAGIGLLLAIGFSSPVVIVTSLALLIIGIGLHFLSRVPNSPSQLERQANEFWSSI